ncbi:hypothetical protein AB0P21_31790 [Kribbella sp. NPDC056861]|uniref:hypothetical protein n=1 Tax=Kribbella sp. NPDC056861 TaxID=3154857 RepID=UPI00342B53C4
MSSQLTQRIRRTRVIVAMLYLGVPLLFLALTLRISAQADTFAWWAVLVPLALLALGWVWWRGGRLTPDRWSGTGMMVGGIAALATVLLVNQLDVPGVLYRVAAVGFGVVGWLGGRYGAHTLLQPPIAELADTQYELSYRMRGLTRLRLVIGADSVSLREKVRVKAAHGEDSWSTDSTTFPLAAVTGVHVVDLSGAERLRYPVSLTLPPAGTPGPALILQAQGQDWVLPQNQAAAVAEILQRRIATARTR